jgi:hypothetical protein
MLRVAEAFRRKREPSKTGWAGHHTYDTIVTGFSQIVKSDTQAKTSAIATLRPERSDLLRTRMSPPMDVPSAVEPTTDRW